MNDLPAYYAKRAAEYERIYNKPERQDDLRVLEALVERTFSGAHVFEVACGTGYWTEVVCRGAASVTATDINDEVLAIARTKAVDVSRVTFRKENAYALAKPSRTFDGGLCVFWWSHVPRATLGDFLEGFHSVLTPGARVLFIDNRYVEGSSTPISRTDEHGNTYQNRRLDDGSVHEVMKNFPDETELRNAVNDIGEEVKIELLPYFWVLTYRVKRSRFGGAVDRPRHNCQ